jgi:predicted enzyme related to lactoylglutathione lyase
MVEFKGYDEGTPCWVDLMTPDVGRAKRFYTDVFGWDFTDTGMEYHIATVRGKQVAGLGQQQPDQPGPSVWVTYLWADDADSVGDRVTKAGGNVFMGPMDVPGAGRMALALDSTGAAFGIWQGREHRGAQLANEHGAFTWNENMNDAPDKAREFYRDVYGYEYDEMPGWPGGYHTFKVNGAIRGGIGAKPQQVPEGAPNFWNNYFAVADTDAAVAKITESGGSITVPPMDTPAGRMAVAADPAGAGFCVIALSTPA